MEINKKILLEKFWFHIFVIYYFQSVEMDDIESFIDQLENLSSDYKLAYDSLRNLKGVNVDFTLIQKRMTISILFFMS